MSSMDELVPWHNLNENEIAWCLTELAKRRDLTDVKRDFDYLFYPKTVSGGALMELPGKYPEVFLECEKKTVANIAGRWLAHASLRLDKLNDIIKKAEVPRITNFLRKPIKVEDPETGEMKDDFEVVEVYDFNFSASLKAIELSQREEFTAKKLLIEVRRSDLDAPGVGRSAFTATVVDAGNFDDDEVINRPLPEIEKDKEEESE